MTVAAPEPLEVARALEVVRGEVRPVGVEQVALVHAPGRVLADDVRAVDPVPGFDGSAMDGFALRAEDSASATAAAPVRLTIAGESSAGHPFAGSLPPGACVRISTGAVVPDDADAVIRLEEAVAEDGAILLSAAVPVGNDVRGAGEDIRGGALVLGAGTRIAAVELGVLASLGCPRVEVRCRPRVAVLVTGDELIGPEEPARPGSVRNSNAYVLSGLAGEAGAEVVSADRVGDDREATIAAIRGGLDADVLVITGGVSVGPHDHVKSALAELGVEQRFWRLALRPGRPTWFGVAAPATLVFGLPGNPVSAAVTFDLFVRVALLEMQGLSSARRTVRAVLEEPYPKSPGRAHYVRFSADLRCDRWYVRPTGDQSSHVLTSMLGVDAVGLVPSASAGLEAGDEIDVQLLPRSLETGTRLP